MIITIAGDLGSGKSSVAKEVAKKIDFTYISTGYLHRKIAEEYSVDALKLNEIAQNDESIDCRIDSYLKSLNETNEDLIIDSRLAWHFVKKSIRIFFEVNPAIAVRRIIGDTSRYNEPIYNDEAMALEKLNERKRIENIRFFEKYGVDCNNLSNYDIIINTSLASIEDVTNMVISIVEMTTKNEQIPKYWVNPMLLYPTENIRLVAKPEAVEIKNNISKNNFNMEHPVACVKYNNNYFIWDGHKRTSGALYSQLKLIPIIVIAKDNEDIHAGHSVSRFIKGVLNHSLYYDWEDAHSFRYIEYPSL